MMRLSTPRHQRFRQASNLEVEYGGGESNVAVSLANYGQQVRFVSRVPDNDLGECAIRSLRAAGIDTSYIVRGGKRLGIYFLETGAVQRPSKVIYDREDSSMATISPGDIDWDVALEDVDWFHWSGITPGGECIGGRGVCRGMSCGHRAGHLRQCRSQPPQQVMAIR